MLIHLVDNLFYVMGEPLIEWSHLASFVYPPCFPSMTFVEIANQGPSRPRNSILKSIRLDTHENTQNARTTKRQQLLPLLSFLSTQPAPTTLLGFHTIAKYFVTLTRHDRRHAVQKYSCRRATTEAVGLMTGPRRSEWCAHCCRIEGTR